MNLLASPRRAVLALAAAIGVLAGIAPWPVTRTGWIGAIDRQLREAFALDRLDMGEVNLTLLPLPRLEISGLTFHAAGGHSGTVHRMRLPLSLAALLGGSVQARDIAVKGADVTLATAVPLPTLEPRLMLADAASASRMLADVRQRSGIERIRIDHATVRFKAPDDETAYTGIAVQMDLPHGSSPLHVKAQGQQATTPLALTFTGAAPEALTATAPAPLDLSLSGAGWSLAATGKAAFVNDGAFKGTVTVSQAEGSAAPLALVLAPLGIATTPAVNLIAKLDAIGRNTTLSDLAIDIARDRYLGVGAIRRDNGRWHLSATLATARSDLSWAFAPLLRMRSAEGAWNTASFAADSLFASTIDLRLSADKLQIHQTVMDRAALTLITRPARFELGLGEAVLHGGSARARVIATPNSDGLDIKLTSTIDGGELGQTFVNLGMERRVRGIGSATIALDATGRTAAELASSANGRMQMSLRDGDLFGIDLHRLADRKPSKPGAGLAEALNGKTPFDSITLSSRVQQGAIGPIEGRMQAGRLVGALAGTIDLPQGQHKLGGNVVQINADQVFTEPQPVLEFSISGPLGAPRIEPNVQALLNRS